MHGCISDLGHPGVGAVQGSDAVHCIAVMHGCISDLGHPGVGAAQCSALHCSNAGLHFRSRTSRCWGSRRTCDAVHCSDAVMHGYISDLGHPGVRVAHCGDALHCSAVMHGWLHFRSRTSRCRGSRRTCDAVHCIAVTHGCISDLVHPGVGAVGGHVMQYIALQ